MQQKKKISTGPLSLLNVSDYNTVLQNACKMDLLLLNSEVKILDNNSEKSP